MCPATFKLGTCLFGERSWEHQQLQPWRMRPTAAASRLVLEQMQAWMKEPGSHWSQPGFCSSLGTTPDTLRETARLSKVPFGKANLHHERRLLAAATHALPQYPVFQGSRDKGISSVISMKVYRGFRAASIAPAPSAGSASLAKKTSNNTKCADWLHSPLLAAHPHFV